MSALIKSSVLLLLATAVAGSLFLVFDGGVMDLAGPQPRDGICKQDGERLARLRANPSLDEGLRFVGEIRCMRLWPQLQAVVDDLSNPSRSIAVSSLKGAESDASTISNTSPAAAPPRPTSAALDDACKHDDERLTELKAKPSLDEAVRFAGELQCPKLQPQVLALLASLSQGPQSAGTPSPLGATSPIGVAPPTSEAPAAEAASAAPPNPTSAGETAPSALASPTVGATSATLDDACRRDEDRLGRLRQDFSREEVERFAEALICERLRPQLLALVDDSVKQPLPSAADASKGTAAETSTTNGAPLAFDAFATFAAAANRRIAALERGRDTLAAKVDRLERHQETPLEQVAAPPPQPAVAAERSDSEHPSQAIVDAERRIATLESEKETLAAEVSKLQSDQEAASIKQASSMPLHKRAVPAEPPESQAASQAAGERDALAAKADRLERHQDTSHEQVAAPPSPRTLASSPNLTLATLPVGPPNSKANTSNFEPSPKLASLPDGMPPRVLIRYPRNNAAARRRAEDLADGLTKQGLEVADVRESDGATRTELRFFYDPDATIAQRIGGLVGIAPVRQPQQKDGLMARPGAIELRLSGDSHLEVVNTSRKESMHE
jgi:hypothetical protein